MIEIGDCLRFGATSFACSSFKWRSLRSYGIDRKMGCLVSKVGTMIRVGSMGIEMSRN
mgnify:CR=1 FL=1